MLEVRDIHFYYGRIHALQGVSLEIPAGKVVCCMTTDEPSTIGNHENAHWPEW